MALYGDSTVWSPNDFPILGPCPLGLNKIDGMPYAFSAELPGLETLSSEQA